MHELSIAMNIIDIVEAEKTRNNADKIRSIELEIGALSGVIMEALQFAFDEAIKSSSFSEAEIIYHQVEGLAECSACGHRFKTEDYITPCPECMHPFSDIISGKEMRIRSIVIE